MPKAALAAGFDSYDCFHAASAQKFLLIPRHSLYNITYQVEYACARSEVPAISSKWIAMLRSDQHLGQGCNSALPLELTLPSDMQLRYVDEGFSDPAKPVILESGTKDDVYPAQYYGCPYEPTASTPCNAPRTCNVNGNGQSIGPCIG